MKNKFLLAIGLLFLVRMVFAFLVWHPDVRNHVDWGERFFDYGAQGFYAPEANVWDYTWPNQPPGTMIMFAAMHQLFQFKFSILTWVNQNLPLFPSTMMYFFELRLYPAMVKLPGIVADFGIAFIIYRIIRDYLSEKKLAQYGAILYLINPVVWYNSSVWGQYDSVINALSLFAFYLLLRKKIVFAFLALGLSLYIKISLAIFVPVFILLLFKLRISVRNFSIATLISLLLFVAITLVFSFPQNPITWLYTLYTERVLGQQLHVITANAFNVWAFLTGIQEQPDGLLWGPLSYQYWGYVLFVPVYLYSLWNIWKRKGELSVYSGLAVIAFASFILLTNMHERYLYPLFPYFTVLAVVNKKLRWLYWTVSILSLLNMYNYWFTPNIPLLVNIFEYQGRIVPRILGGVMTTLFVYSFILFTKNRLVKSKAEV